MTDPLGLLQHLVGSAGSAPAALALIVGRAGSAPASVGAMMVQVAGRPPQGCIGGGRLEHEVLGELSCLRPGDPPRLRRFHLSPEDAGMPCGGRVEVLLTPIGPGHRPMLEGLAVRLAHGEGCHLMVEVDESGAVSWGTGAQLAAPTQVYSVPMAPTPRLLIFGAGHIAQALAPMAQAAGLAVTVLDDRAGYLATHPFPDGVAIHRLLDFDSALGGLEVRESTPLVVATYGHLQDRAVVSQALATPAHYIGVVGSRRKRELLLTHLSASGWGADELQRVRCPAGLPIGARTAAEIAVSILAQLIAVRHGQA